MSKNKCLEMTLNETVVPDLLRVYGNRFNRLWKFQDGAPAHRLRIVNERLRELFNNRIVALNHDIEWPPRSPNLTPCHYFLCGYLKNKVYYNQRENINQLRERIMHEVILLKENPHMIKKVMRAMRSKAQLCFDRNGGHVEGNGA